MDLILCVEAWSCRRRARIWSGLTCVMSMSIIAYLRFRLFTLILHASKDADSLMITSKVSDSTRRSHVIVMLFYGSCSSRVFPTQLFVRSFVRISYNM
jgi:hypothetical protein